MRVREYKVSDYNQVIMLWMKCGLIDRAEKVTELDLSIASRRNRGRFLVCEDDELKVIGTVLGAWDGWRGWIYKLAVSPEMRRKGVGTILVKEVCARLRKAGARIARAYIDESNDASLALFAMSGFERMEGFVIVTLGRQ